MVRVTLGLSLSLSGAFAPIGRQAQDALRMFVADANAGDAVLVNGERAEFVLRCYDDRSEPARVAEIYRELCSDPGASILLGPYSSELTAVAAAIADSAGRLFINHGGAADHLYERGYRTIVGLQTPASEYLHQFVRLLASLKFWRKRLAMITQPTDFARAIMNGAEESARLPGIRRQGVRIRVKWEEPLGPGDSARLINELRRGRVNALVSAGAYSHDLTVMRTVLRSDLRIPVLACVAAGLTRFRSDLGDMVEGIVGPSQWEPSFQAIPELGPDAREFTHRMRTQTRSGECDYIGAQAYAAGVLAVEVLRKEGSCDQARMREQFSALRTGTLFGAFTIDPVTGRQTAHHLITVQWHQGRKLTIEPEPLSTRGSLEFPAGWRLLTAGARMLRLTRSRKPLDGSDVARD